MSEILLGIVVLLALGTTVWTAGQWARTTARQPEDRLAELERMLKTYRREVDELHDYVGRWGGKITKRAQRDGDVSPAEAEAPSREELRRQLRVKWGSSARSKRA